MLFLRPTHCSLSFSHAMTIYIIFPWPCTNPNTNQPATFFYHLLLRSRLGICPDHGAPHQAGGTGTCCCRRHRRQQNKQSQVGQLCANFLVHSFFFFFHIFDLPVTTQMDIFAKLCCAHFALFFLSIFLYFDFSPSTNLQFGLSIVLENVCHYCQLHNSIVVSQCFNAFSPLRNKVLIYLKRL